jgi:hypothetical protein
MSNAQPIEKRMELAAEMFLGGLESLGLCKYTRAAASFSRAQAEYERQARPQKPDRHALEETYQIQLGHDKTYQLFKFCAEWSRGLAAYHESDFIQARSAFDSACQTLSQLPQATINTFAPALDFFRKMVPIDERLKELFTHPYPRGLDYLADELEKVFEPLSQLSVQSVWESAPEGIYILLRAKVNICAILLYLLGREPFAALVGVIRSEDPTQFKDEPERTIQWLLAQEQMALLEIGFEQSPEFIHGVSRFAKELIRLGAPANLKLIPEEIRIKLPALLNPKKDKTENIYFQLELMEPVVRRALTKAVKEVFQEEKWTKLFKRSIKTQESSAVTRVKIHLPKVRFAMPKKTTWSDVLIQFLDRGKVKIEAKGTSRKYTFKQLGFEDKRTHNPDNQWHILRQMARTQGVFSWVSPGAGKHVPKSIQFIRQRLRALFGLMPDPFYPYQRRHGYRARFKLEDISGEDPWAEYDKTDLNQESLQRGGTKISTMPNDIIDQIGEEDDE